MAGTDRYELGAPLFERAEVRLAGGRLSVVAEDYAPDRAYADEVRLNGEPLDRWWVRHEEIAGGAELRFHMAATPTAAISRPR